MTELVWLSWRADQYVYTKDGKVHTSGWVFRMPKSFKHTLGPKAGDLVYVPIWMRQ